MPTIFYPFHRWIEPSSTAATVVLAFGGWWDANAPAGVAIASDDDDAYLLVPGSGAPVQGFEINIGDYGGTEETDGVLRFVSLGIPQGATITSATLRVISTADLADTPDLDVYAYDEDDAIFPTDASDHSGRSLTTATEPWSPGATTVGVEETVDITSVVQEWIDRPGVDETSALVIVIKAPGTLGTGDIFVFADYEHATYAPATLLVEWTPAAPGGVVSTLMLLGVG